MSDKPNYVAKELSVCPICGEEHTTGVLLKKKWTGKGINDAVTGYALCPEHQDMYDTGFVALIEIDTTKPKPEENIYWRTGEVMHMRKDMCCEMFPTLEIGNHPFIHVEIGVIELVKNMYYEVTGESEIPSIDEVHQNETKH